MKMSMYLSLFFSLPFKFNGRGLRGKLEKRGSEIKICTRILVLFNVFDYNGYFDRRHNVDNRLIDEKFSEKGFKGSIDKVPIFEQNKQHQTQCSEI